MVTLINNLAAACTAPGSGNDLIGKGCLPQSAASSDTLHTIFLISFTVIGAVAFFFLVLGGFRYITSGGNPDGVQKAKNQIQYSLIGLVIVALAAAIVNFAIGRLSNG